MGSSSAKLRTAKVRNIIVIHMFESNPWFVLPSGQEERHFKLEKSDYPRTGEQIYEFSAGNRITQKNNTLYLMIALNIFLILLCSKNQKL